MLIPLRSIRTSQPGRSGINQLKGFVMSEEGTRLSDPMPLPEIATINEDADGDVTLTLKKGKFAEFLFGFLGTRETLTKTFRYDFTIKIDDILQFHYLLTEKTSKEQFISLSLVTATIHYDDKTSRTINTFEAINKYYEYRDVNAISFNMSWNYVFRAPDQGSIQQQKVALFFEPVPTDREFGSITVTIKHTNQVWAAEVMRLFEEQIGKIRIDYTLGYRALRAMKRFGVFSTVLSICMLCILGGGIYIAVQRMNLHSPLTVKEEFIFDVADILAKNIDDQDINLFIQFFLIRDLEKASRSIISSLRIKSYFHPKYNDIIDKLESGYYDREKESDKIVYTPESILAEIKAMQNIRWMYSYLRIIMLYVIGYVFVSIYLKLFKMKSILALTSKGLKRMNKQAQAKSITFQFVFGVLASVIAAIIYEYSITLLLMK